MFVLGKNCDNLNAISPLIPARPLSNLDTVALLTPNLSAASATESPALSIIIS